MHYKIFISNPAEHFMRVEWQFAIAPDAGTDEKKLQVQLPAWRPGRYELANYAKNIRCFSVKNNRGEKMRFKKITKDRWEIFTNGEDEIIVQYEYYANQYDAGASYAGHDVLYVNPVNCLMYVVGRMNEASSIELDVPDDYLIACQLPSIGKTLHANNFDELADSPFIASATLTHTVFDVEGTKIHFWFQGRPCPFMDRLIADTRAYTLAQIQVFGDLPAKDFHFLYPILPTPFRHGVEHTNSTVIVMGPDTGWESEAFYDDFIAISSHELFHLWNVKRIRPAEMLPYDFTKENYSELGYVYEGITTYYGDLMLLRSKVWSFEQYQLSFNGDLQKHMDNPGRFNYSVAQSSFDTWLDGYVPGIKGRKVSIYMEGMLAALIADIMILDATGGNARLDDVLKALYEETYKVGTGYTRQQYKSLLERVSGVSFDAYFEEVIEGCGFIEQYLNRALETIGLEFIQLPADANGICAVKLLPMNEINDRRQLLFKIWCGLT